MVNGGPHRRSRLVDSGLAVIRSGVAIPTKRTCGRRFLRCLRREQRFTVKLPDAANVVEAGRFRKVRAARSPGRR